MAGTLRQVRACCQYIDGALAKLEESLKGASADLQRAGVVQQTTDRRAELASGVETGEAFVTEAKSLVTGSRYLRDWIADEVTRIGLNWTDAARNIDEVDAALAAALANPTAVLPDTLKADVGEARAAVRVIILAVASITIPLRLNEHLQGALPGQSVSFKSLFEDELPDQADRKEVLRRMAEAPATVDGIVDVESGTIIKISPSLRRRRQSYIWEATALFLGGAIAFLVVAFIRNFISTSNGIHVPDAAAWASLNQLAVLLVVFSTGAGFHLVLDLIKSRQGGVGSPLRAGFDSWLIWLHARELNVISSILALWFVFGAVLILAPGGMPDALTAFFAGYFFDSVADVVIKRFEAFAPDQLASVTKLVSAEDGTTK
jgi:hypothetical protein